MKLPDWLISALNDGSTPPQVSMTRLLALIAVVSTIVLPSLVIFELSLLGGKPVAIPDGWVGFTSAASAAVTALFIFNKRAE